MPSKAWVLVVFATAVLASLTITLRNAYPVGWGIFSPPSQTASSGPDLAHWSPARAMGHISSLLPYAPRSPGKSGHGKTIAYIEQELARSGLRVQRQSFTWVRKDGARLQYTNLIARLNPSEPKRVLVGTHYDSISRAYRDLHRPNDPMPGANNSASGVAVLLETARLLSGTSPRPKVGVDFVFFDGEEGPYALGGADPDWRPLGSQHFVRKLQDFYTQKPLSVVILDLVCRKGLRLNPERNSLKTGRGEVQKMWQVGTALAPDVFEWRAQGGVGDDHTPFWQADIPAILLVDIRSTEWFNTTGDTLDKCRPESLGAVGRTLTRYIYLPPRLQDRGQ